MTKARHEPPSRRYENFMFDTARWDSFTPRDGDVVVCTSYKAGTTWTQMICALLIHKTSDLPRSLAELSPWLEMKLSPIERVIDYFETQTTRRVIKSHTPFDGIPRYDNVQYVYCGRDPRDVFVSLQNHLDNADMDKALGLLEAQGIEVDVPPDLPDDVHDRFALWMTTPTFEWEQDGLPYWSHFHHAQTFWEERHRDNMHLLHFADLKADLDGEMHRVADFLGVDVPDATWPQLVEAATFESMKANAGRTAPDTHHGIWKSNARFFNSGANEQWRSVLNDADLDLYQRLSRERYDGALLTWLEQGSAAAGRPQG